MSIKRIAILFSFIINTNILTAQLKVDFSTGNRSETKEVKKKNLNRVTVNDIHRLELMIVKLKKRVEILEFRLNKSKPNKPRSEQKQKEVIWGCYLQDSFGRTYSGEGKTKSHASSEALKKCSGGLSCEAEKLNCSRSSVR